MSNSYICSKRSVSSPRRSNKFLPFTAPNAKCFRLYPRREKLEILLLLSARTTHELQPGRADGLMPQSEYLRFTVDSLFVETRLLLQRNLLAHSKASSVVSSDGFEDNSGCIDNCAS